MEIAVVIYEGFTALDAVGPYEVLSRLPGARVRFVAKEAGPVTTDNGMLTLVAEAALRDVPAPDVVVVAGGTSTRRFCDDAEILDWLRAAHETSTWTTSVCTGSLLLAAAGILAGLRATTHWVDLDALRDYGVEATGEERVVVQGKVVTAAGVSAGIDMGLTLAARIAGDLVAQTIQLGIEYDPQPPFDSGSVAKAPPESVAIIRALLAAREDGAAADRVASAATS